MVAQGKPYASGNTRPLTIGQLTFLMPAQYVVSGSPLNSSGTITVTNASQTQNFSTIGAAPAVSISTTGAFVFASFTIRAKFNTVITIKTNLTTSIGSINYDVGGTIQRMN